MAKRMERLASARLVSTPAKVAQEIAFSAGFMASPGMGALPAVFGLRCVTPRRSRSLPGSPAAGSERSHHAIAAPQSARVAVLDTETKAHHGTCTKDAVLLQALLDKVTSLSIEKERLSDQAACLQEHSAGLQRQVAALQWEKQQLSSLVLDLADTLQQQQHQARLLLYLQRQRLINAAAAGSSRMAPALKPAPVAFITSQQQQEGSDDNDDDLTEISATLPFVGLQQQDQAQDQAKQQPHHHQQQQQQHLVDSVRSSQHRVAEWLQERGWQEWQEKLPLEPMSSTSSSSIIMALEDGMLRN